MYVLSLNFQPFVSRRIKEEALSLLIFYYCICDCPCWWRLMSFVVISAVFCHCLKARMSLVEFYPIRASEQTHGWRHGKIVLFVLSNMAHSFVHVCTFFMIITNWTNEGLQKIKQELLISKRKKKKKAHIKVFLVTWKMPSILTIFQFIMWSNFPAQHFQSLTSTVNIILAAFFYPNTKFIYADALPDFKAVKQSAYKLQAVLSNRG